MSRKMPTIPDRLIEFFMKYPGEPISHQLLYRKGWGFEYPEDAILADSVNNTIRVHIHNLRKYIEEEGIVGRIDTVPGVGYVYYDEDGQENV